MSVAECGALMPRLSCFTGAALYGSRGDLAPLLDLDVMTDGPRNAPKQRGISLWVRFISVHFNFLIITISL